MKNLKFFPFERNRYFYGKFLSVDDFEAEQRYMNDKRRLLNRLLHGCGVVCGLQVVEADETTIALEAGLALDFSGREIVVASPVTTRLSAIEGYSSCGEAGEERQHIYLCIAYAEREVEPVHNITRSSEEQGEEYNKYAESYRLFLTGEEPEWEGAQRSSMYEESRTVFRGDGVRILQTVPRYVRSGEEMEITVTVEKESVSDPVSFTYQLRLQYMEQGGNPIAVIEFEENQFAPSKTYVLRFPVRAKEIREAEGSIEVVPDSFLFSIGQDSRRERIYGRFPVRITEDSVPDAVLRQYYDSSLDDIVQDLYGQNIYLAEIEVIWTGRTCVIERIKNLPYGQYVWNGRLSESLETYRLRQGIPGGQTLCEPPGRGGQIPAQAAPGATVREKEDPELLQPAAKESRVRTGTTVIDLGTGGVEGQCYYSGEILHGLGPGGVFLSLGLARNAREGAQIIYGSQNIFAGEKGPDIEMAAKANLSKGSFVIGIQCLGPVEMKKLRICWMAVRDESKKRERVATIEIRPNIANLHIRESCYFEAVMGDRVLRHVKWSVMEPEGGNIDDRGCYTAPNQFGVYRVMAQSTVQSGTVQAVGYVFVRDA